MKVFKYTAVRARQAEGHNVFSFAAQPKDILAFSEIERVSRHEDGQLKGFQRHQIASHIKEIRDYLAREDSLLPNAVIVAFIEGEGAKVRDVAPGVIEVEIALDDKKSGFIVDGQQRLTALSGLDKPGFEVFVSALICKDYNELRQQFVLINNTRPLPKTLIYELLPNVEGLPERFTARKFAARLVDRLNFTPDSTLFSEIRQHTNPRGVISDTAMQKLIMNSASDGAIRNLIKLDDFETRAYDLVNEYFKAVRQVFGAEWNGMQPRTSRLKHGAGIVSMGFVMELLYSSRDAMKCEDFVPGLQLLREFTAWTSGHWRFDDYDVRPWNEIQNTPSDIDLLSNYLVRSLKKALRRQLKVVNG
jgi:DGQHR domain-containing protein